MPTITLLGKDGQVRGTTEVDDADLGFVNQWAWRLVARQYAGRAVHVPEEGRARIIYLHRELMGLAFGDKRQVDHVNQDKLDNRRSNLRVVTSAQQSQNRPSPRHARSAHRGVCWNSDRQCWRAAVRVDGRTYRGPRRNDEELAAEDARHLRALHMTHSED